MKINLKMALLFTYFTTYLSAENILKFKTLSWNWITVIVLAILFLLLIFSVMKDIRSNKNKNKNSIMQKKSKDISNRSYINDINNSRINSTKELKDDIDTLSKELDDIEGIERLKRRYKEIFLSNKEEEIFLNIINDEKIGTAEEFKLNSLLKGLSEFNITNQPNIVSTNSKLFANKDAILNIIFLLNKHQTTEHSYKESKFDIYLEEDPNSLTIDIDRELKLNRHIETLFSNEIEPIYSKKSHKYYGVYLYLVKKLANQINAKLIINSDKEDTYRVSISIPIDIKYNSVVKTIPNRVLNRTKKALIISDYESGYILSEHLKSLNFNVKIDSTKKLNKEIPNFMDYDIAFIDGSYFEPILTEYLITIKKYSELKVIALLSDENKLYPSNLVEERVEIEKIDQELYNKIENIYDSEMVDKDSHKLVDNNIPKKTNKLSKRVKILIADDDRTNLHILEYMLKKYDIDVVTHTNGVDVLTSLKKERFDMVLLDSIMPRLDGYETIKKIREDEEYNAIPVIIHTSFSTNKSSMDSIFKIGFDSYLPKPFDSSELDKLLKRYLSIEINSNTKKSLLKHRDRDSLKEFIVIYGESDKMLEKYIKEHRETQALSLLQDLKSIARDIDANELVSSLIDIESAINDNSIFDNSLIYSMSNRLQLLKSNIIKELSA